ERLTLADAALESLPQCHVEINDTAMTETEWLACNDPRPMLDFLRGKASQRKLRLFACACCRQAWNLLPLEGQWAIEVAERYADGKADPEELGRARRSVEEIACRVGGALWYSGWWTDELFGAKDGALSDPESAPWVPAWMATLDNPY